MKHYYYFFSDGRLAGIYTSEQAAEVQAARPRAR